MHRFKVGDKIRIVAKRSSVGHRYHGKILTISGVNTMHNRATCEGRFYDLMGGGSVWEDEVESIVKPKVKPYKVAEFLNALK